MSKRPFARVPAEALSQITQDQLDARWQDLTRQIQVEIIQTILQTCQVSGVADFQQLQTITGVSRDRLNRILDLLTATMRSLPSVLKLYPRALGRPGERGRARRVYLLGELGASYLERLEEGEFSACNLADDVPVLHAIAMLDLHLCAQTAGLAIQTDKTVRYAETKEIRPDHQVRLKDGSLALFEIEQAATPETLRRVMESLRHKQDFFQNEAGKQFSPDIRMLVTLPPGKDREKTYRMWEQAEDQICQKSGGQLAFRLLVMPLADFLEAPDWECAGASWRDILPQQNATSESDSTEIVAVKPGKLAKSALPRELLYRTAHDDALVLGALWQSFLETAQLQQEEFHMPDPEFLNLVRLIYVASHDASQPALQQAAVPYASIYLLQQYLVMHPRLVESLRSRIHSGKGAVRWNSATILHKMQFVFDGFLSYHGWRSTGLLTAFAKMSDWNCEETRTFGVNVRILDPELLMCPGDVVVPTQSEVFLTERALTWVLTALFAHSQELQLGRVDFW